MTFPIDIKSRREVLKTVPFTLEELDLTRNGTPVSHPYHRLISADWVNVLPITSDHKAVLIRQPRVGVMKTILEVPGGVIDPEERDPTLAAARELEEETGYNSQRLLALGSIYANPAIMNNRCHFFLAFNCAPVIDRKHFPDADEQIETVLVDVAELDGLVRTGRMDHALSALCILLAGKYLNRSV